MGSRGIVRPGSGADRWFELKSQVHQKLVNSLTPEQLKDLNKDSVRGQIGTVVEKLIIDESLPMTMGEREKLIEEILDEVFGLGPLEVLLKDPTISDIMVNGFDNVYVERAGRVVETNIRFKDHAHVRMIIERIVSAIGRRIDDSSPIVDARLADGSRVCAVIPPLSLIGPVMSIRRYGKRVLTTEDLLKNETFTTGMLDFMSGCVEARLNIVISGGSGSGKTTMLNTLSRFIPEEERIVTIEDTAELNLQQRSRGAAGNASGQHRRRRRDHAARPADQHAAYAARPHHRRRIARPRSAGHAAGHEHGPRRLHDHGARQHHARRVLAPGDHGHDGQPARARQSHPPATGERHPYRDALLPPGGRHAQGDGHRRGGGRGERSWWRCRTSSSSNAPASARAARWWAASAAAAIRRSAWSG